MIEAAIENYLSKAGLGTKGRGGHPHGYPPRSPLLGSKGLSLCHRRPGSKITDHQVPGILRRKYHIRLNIIRVRTNIFIV